MAAAAGTQRALLSRKQNYAELISATECSLLMFYVSLPINWGKLIFCSRKQTLVSESAWQEMRIRSVNDKVRDHFD